MDCLELLIPTSIKRERKLQIGTAVTFFSLESITRRLLYKLVRTRKHYVRTTHAREGT